MLYTRPVESFVNGLIPVFLAATMAVLGIGIGAMFVGGRFNRSYSNLLMRWRVLLQFAAIIIMMAGLWFANR